MSDKTGIEWTDATWSPIRGCSRVSQGCVNCYAERVAHRFSGPGQPYEGLTDAKGRWNGTVRFVPEHLADPLRWKRPRRIFVNSMSDLFHDALTDEQIAAVFGVMAAAPHHQFQVLTKRPERALQWLRAVMADWKYPKAWCVGRADDIGALWPGWQTTKLDGPWPLPNVWLGVSVEDQATADARIPVLLQCPAAVRWISAEPLLGPVTLAPVWLPPHTDPPIYSKRVSGLHDGPNSGLRWLVVGGESGPGARPMHPGWARSLRDQCVAAGVAFHFKQWGCWADVGDAHDLAASGVPKAANERIVNRAGGHGFHGEDPRRMRRVGKKAAGRVLDGRTWEEWPEVPHA